MAKKAKKRGPYKTRSTPTTTTSSMNGSSIFAHTLVRQHAGSATKFDFGIRSQTKRAILTKAGIEKIGITAKDYLMVADVDGKVFLAVKPRGIFGGFALTTKPSKTGNIPFNSNAFAQASSGDYLLTGKTKTETVQTEQEKDVEIVWHECEVM